MGWSTGSELYAEKWPWGFVGRLLRLTPLGCIHPECGRYYARPRSSVPDGIEAEVAKAESSKLPEVRDDK